MDHIEQAISQLVAGHADRESILNAVKPDTELSEFYNSLSLGIARSFIDGSLSFDDADGAINDLYGIWISDELIEDLLEPAYSIYLAFDAGEYSVDGTDSIDLITRPELRKFLVDA
jgi:hypothetical protein